MVTIDTSDYNTRDLFRNHDAANLQVGVRMESSCMGG